MLRRVVVVLAVVVSGVASVSVDGASGQGPVPAGAASVAAQLGAVIKAQVPQVQQAVQQAQARRETPAARAVQQRSRHAFAGLDRAAALAADVSAFPQINSVPWNASMLVPKGGRLESYIGTGKQDAVVSFAGVKRRAVLESAAPLIGTGPAGTTAPADSALESVSGGFAPVSSPTVMHAPAAADGALSFANLGIGIAVVGAGNSPGELVAGRAWYPSALRDTDLGWAATPAGAADLSLVLRSEAAPQTISLALTLPAGVSVRPTGPLDTIPAAPGSLEIAAGNTRLALIQPASAIDAQGRDVPVTYSVTSPGVVAVHLDVPADAAYPIVVDPATQPVIEGYPGGGQGNEVGYCWNNWGFYTNNTGYEPLVEPSGGSSDALFLFAGTGYYYPAASFGECARLAPANSFIFSVQFYNSSLVQNGYPVTSTEGLYDAGTLTYMLGGWTNQTDPLHPVTGSDSGYAVQGFAPSISGQVYQFCATVCSAATTTVPDGSYAFFTLAAYSAFSSGANPPYSASGTASTYASDRYAPIAGTDSETPALPTGWVKSVTQTSLLGASDEGLGMHTISVSGPGIVAQTGSSLTAAASCNGTSESPCPAIFTTPSPGIKWQTSASTPDGVDTVTYTDTDIVGNATQTTHTIKIDKTPPVFGALSGSLATATSAGGPLTLPVYTLTVPVTDVTSGVQSITSAITNCPGYTPANATQSPAPGAPLTDLITLNALGCTRGLHTLTVTATDAAGNTATTTLSFDLEPQSGATGYSQYESQKLDDRMGLSENIGTGNLALTANDVSIAGTAGMNLAVTRTYNALGYPNLPTQTQYDATDLSPGWRLSIGPDVHLETTTATTNLPVGDVRYYDPTGATYVFTPTGTAGQFTPAAGLPATLTQNTTNGTYTLSSLLDKSSYTFASPVSGMAPAPLASETDANGNSIILNYVPGTCGSTVGCEISTIQGTQGQTLAFTYNGSGQLSQIQDSSGRKWQYNYDSNRNLNLYTDPTGAQTKYQYNATTDLLTGVTDPNGHTTTMIYTASPATNQIASVTEPDGTTHGQVTSFAYSPNETDVTSPNGYLTTTGYVTKYVLDSFGRVLETTDPDGFATGTTWTQSSPGVSSSTMTNAVSSDPSTGATTLTTYKTLTDYRPTQTAEQSGATNKCTYPTSGPNQYVPATCTDDLGNVLTYTYDSNNNLETTSGVVSGHTQTPVNLAYNLPNTALAGTVSQSIDGDNNKTLYTYNAIGQLVTATPPVIAPPAAPLGSTTTTYDAAGRVHSTTDGAGRATTYTYDGDDRVLTTVTSGGGSGTSTITYTYDGNGNETTMSDPTGKTTYTPDQANRLVTELRPDGTSASYGYDEDDNLTSLNDGLNDIETFAYDAADRLQGVTAMTAIGAETWSYVYQYTAPSSAMQLTGTTITDPNGIVEQDTLSNGQLTGIKYTGTAGTLTSFNYSYKLPSPSTLVSDLVQSRTTQNGTVTTYGYDTFDRLTSAVSILSGSQTASYQYTYDGASNRSTQVANGTTTTYAYNAGDELSTATQGGSARTFTYDGAGDQLTDSTGETAAYNQLNQTSNFSGATTLNPTYRGAGQSDRTTALSGLLGTVSATDSALGTTSLKNTTLLGLGLSGNDNTTPGTSQVIRDPAGNLLGISITSTLLNLGSLGLPLGSTTANLTYATDDQGSVTAAYAPNQTAADTYTYDPYGNTTATESTPQPFRFQGQYQDATGLYHMGQRYYDPSTGRWLQPDPAPQAPDPSWNPYGYADEDPSNDTDPSGYLTNSCHLFHRQCHLDLSRAQTVKLAAYFVRHDIQTAAELAAAGGSVCGAIGGLAGAFLGNIPGAVVGVAVGEFACGILSAIAGQALIDVTERAAHAGSCVSLQYPNPLALDFTSFGAATDFGSGCRNH